MKYRTMIPIFHGIRFNLGKLPGSDFIQVHFHNSKFKLPLKSPLHQTPHCADQQRQERGDDHLAVAAHIQHEDHLVAQEQDK